MCILLFDVLNGCSGSIKEVNTSVYKGMSNIYYWERITFLKTSIFSERTFEEMQ